MLIWSEIIYVVASWKIYQTAVQRRKQMWRHLTNILTKLAKKEAKNSEIQEQTGRVCLHNAG